MWLKVHNIQNPDKCLIWWLCLSWADQAVKRVWHLFLVKQGHRCVFSGVNNGGKFWHVLELSGLFFCYWISRWNKCRNYLCQGKSAGRQRLIVQPKENLWLTLQKSWENISVQVLSKNVDTVPEGWAAANTVKRQNKYSSVEQTKAGLSPSDICCQAIHQFISNNSSLRGQSVDLSLTLSS